MSSPPASPASPESAAASPRAGRASRGPFVITMIGIAALLFMTTEALLYYRWSTMIEPTCVIIVEAGTQLKGATVEVDGVLLAQPHRIVIGDQDRYTIPVYVEPGEYTLKVTQNDEVLLEPMAVTFTRGAQGKKIDLTHLPAAATRPSTLPTYQPVP